MGFEDERVLKEKFTTITTKQALEIIDMRIDALRRAGTDFKSINQDFLNIDKIMEEHNGGNRSSPNLITEDGDDNLDTSTNYRPQTGLELK